MRDNFLYIGKFHNCEFVELKLNAQVYNWINYNAVEDEMNGARVAENLVFF